MSGGCSLWRRTVCNSRERVKQGVYTQLEATSSLTSYNSDRSNESVAGDLILGKGTLRFFCATPFWLIFKFVDTDAFEDVE